MAPATTSTQPSTSSGTKRKRPPTFQHLPANRAKKLKKSWIETKKLKAKWKAEKRREGLSTNSASLTGHRDNHDDDDDDDDDHSHDSEDDDRHGATDNPMIPQDGDNPSSSDEDAAWDSSVAQGKEGDSYNSDEDGDSATETPSRERAPRLNKPAQSKTMVPNKKTKTNTILDPLHATPHRQRKPKHNDGEQIQNQKNASSRAGLPRTQPQPSERRQKDNAGSGRGRQPRGGGQGRGSRGGKGQQPDMKLRMGALLEKIKRDYT